MNVFPFLSLAQHGAVLVISLARPEKANAYHSPMLDALAQALAYAHASREVRALVLTGAGRSFCAGADRDTFQGRQAEDALSLRSGQLFDQLAQLEKPAVAALNGPAVGGGFELALACELRVGCPEAFCQLPELSLGLLPAAGGIRRLQTLLGGGWTHSLVLTGRRLEPSQALALGLWSELVPAPQVLEAGIRLAEQLAALDPLALRLARTLLEAPEQRSPAWLERVSQAVLYERRAAGARPSTLEKDSP